jgi:FkbM family methyltransferase
MGDRERYVIQSEQHNKRRLSLRAEEDFAMVQQCKTQVVDLDVSSTTTGSVSSGGGQCLSVDERNERNGLSEGSAADTGAEAQGDFIQEGRRTLGDAFWLLVIRVLRGCSRLVPSETDLWRVNDLASKLAGRLSNGHRLVVRSRDGRRFCVDPKEKQYHMGLLGTGVYEPVETRVVMACVSEGDIAFDVGANIGWYTTLLSRLVGSRGTVHAFEPLASTYQVLTGNCRLNTCLNVVLNNIALGDRDGRVTMHYYPDEACGNASMVRASTASSIQSTCGLTTLDAFVLKHHVSRCDFIKCDAEGAEMAFISGACRTLSQFEPSILIELNPHIFAMAGYSSADLLRKIRECGSYRFFSVDKGDYEELIDLETSNGVVGHHNVLCVSERSAMFKRIASLSVAQAS